MHWRTWHPTLVLLPGKPPGQRSLEGYSPEGLSETDMTQHAGLAYIHIHIPVFVIHDDQNLDT